MYLYVYIYVWKRCHIHTIYIYIYMCVYWLYIYICVCVYILIYVYLYTYASIYIYIYAHECIYNTIHICMCICRYCLYIYIYIYISHVYMHACTHVSIGFYTYFPGHHFFYLFWSCYFLGVPFWNSRRLQSLEPVSRSNSTSLVCGNEFLDPRKVLQKALTHFPQAPRRWHFDPKLRFGKYQLWWDFLGFIPEIC